MLIPTVAWNWTRRSGNSPAAAVGVGAQWEPLVAEPLGLQFVLRLKGGVGVGFPACLFERHLERSVAPRRTCAFEDQPAAQQLIGRRSHTRRDDGHQNMIVKKVGVMTPRSRPMLSRMSSIRPRAFMRVPTMAEWRQLSPEMRAAGMQAMPLPRIDTEMTMAVTSQRSSSVHQSDPGVQAGVDEEHGQEERCRELLDAMRQQPAEFSLGHGRSADEGAEHRIDPDGIGDPGAREQDDQDTGKEIHGKLTASPQRSLEAVKRAPSQPEHRHAVGEPASHRIHRDLGAPPEECEYQGKQTPGDGVVDRDRSRTCRGPARPEPTRKGGNDHSELEKQADPDLGAGHREASPASHRMKPAHREHPTCPNRWIETVVTREECGSTLLA